jgi:hypothetical protein
MIIRLLLVSSAVLFLASMGAFFFYVPLFSIATVVSIEVGFILMFGLGVQVGTRGMAPLKGLESRMAPPGA